jgi:hypothetical protein
MKALSLTQPFASLVVDGRKTIETRSWSTRYRGSLAIHATKTPDRVVCRNFGYDPAIISCGAILGVVQLVDCVQFPNPKTPPDKYGDFTVGRWGWLLADVTKLPAPVPVKGYQGLWNWNENL